MSTDTAVEASASRCAALCRGGSSRHGGSRCELRQRLVLRRAMRAATSARSSTTPRSGANSRTRRRSPASAAATRPPSPTSTKARSCSTSAPAAGSTSSSPRSASGPTGVAYGLDMTDEMLALAQQNAREAGLANVHFLKGLIEAIPLPADSVDVVISNCVINLSTDKPAVLTEMARVLQAGGRIGISDVVAEDRLSRGGARRARRASSAASPARSRRASTWRGSRPPASRTSASSSRTRSPTACTARSSRARKPGRLGSRARCRRLLEAETPRPAADSGARLDSIPRVAEEHDSLAGARKDDVARMRFGRPARRQPAAPCPRQDERPRLFTDEGEPRAVGEVPVPHLEPELEVERGRQVRLCRRRAQILRPRGARSHQTALRLLTRRARDGRSARRCCRPGRGSSTRARPSCRNRRRPRRSRDRVGAPRAR